MLVGACGKPGNWSTWWIVDGGDDTDTLRCVDIRAKLNQQLECVERSFRISFGGGISRDIAHIKQRFGIDRRVDIYLSVGMYIDLGQSVDNRLSKIAI